jgi:type I site-specific restriction endonuclease
MKARGRLPSGVQANLKWGAEEVANLLFFKPVYWRITFWQMIGRGTRLCHDLYGPGEDKQDFRVVDFCFNFDFFREKPEGITASDSAPLGTRLFRARVQLLGHIQANPEHIRARAGLTDADAPPVSVGDPGRNGFCSDGAFPAEV